MASSHEIEEIVLERERNVPESPEQRHGPEKGTVTQNSFQV